MIMRLMDETIWREFFRFEISAQAFNALSEDERLKYRNSLRFSVKESLTENITIDPRKLRRVFRMIDKRIETILFA